MWLVTGLPCAAAAFAACSDDGERGFSTGDEDASAAVEASTPPAAEGDASGEDAGVDLDAGTDADVAVAPVYDASDEPVVCAASPCAVQLVAGDNHFCARLEGGTVQCWGANTRGALGAGDTSASLTGPTKVVDLAGVTHLSAAELATCARVNDGRVKCWGGNQQGQLGLRASQPALTDALPHASPADVDIDAGLTRVDVGHRAVCALASGGVYCWGQNNQRQLGRADAGTVATGGPGLVDDRGFVLEQIAAGQTSVFGLTRDQRLVGWGAVSGRESSSTSTAAMGTLPSLEKVTSFAAGPSHACAVAGGRLHCWGTNAKGVLGTGVPDTALLPTPVLIATDGGAYPQQLALSASVSCARMTDGTVHCAGDDAVARGAPGSVSPRFVHVTALSQRAVAVASSLRSVCALVQGGSVMCWGSNANGELGLGTRDADPHPTPSAVVFQDPS